MTKSWGKRAFSDRLLVYIGLGSNLGEGQKNLRAAWQKLGELPEVTLLRLSSPYRTKPVKMSSDKWFTNAVGMLETDLPPEDLLAGLLAIEKAMGRDRKKNRDRTVDLDILFYNTIVLSSEELIIPHPEIQNRLFVLAPLAELMPDYSHPVLKKTATEMLRVLNDPEQAIQKETWQKKE
jgi:2-amino-4-hydroxy-6-hydroxymethyldihydropteridine diphosphokinase